eukprot:TRINITY_DN55427_c0_g1_i1.p1 TRINITY_DN55427_c0_g1~~TRINITY_DN55427_c0_g1_i1.p1  ORF type:complete len:670 (+),score=187.05 TRINITY_DN55427_c0_g1_i1:64-2010(+)
MAPSPGRAAATSPRPRPPTPRTALACWVVCWLPAADAARCACLSQAAVHRRLFGAADLPPLDAGYFVADTELARRARLPADYGSRCNRWDLDPVSLGLFRAPPGGPACATSAPTAAPSRGPSTPPSAGPTGVPSEAPSGAPTAAPSAPTESPSAPPSAPPAGSGAPSGGPSVAPTAAPAVPATPPPSLLPSASPTASPTGGPTAAPNDTNSTNGTSTANGTSGANATLNSTAPTASPTAAPLPGNATAAPSAPPPEQPWCAAHWCYVDPCECDGAAIAETQMFPGKPLFFSYAACCGSLDSAELCGNSTECEWGPAGCAPVRSKAGALQGYLNARCEGRSRMNESACEQYLSCEWDAGADACAASSAPPRPAAGCLEAFAVTFDAAPGLWTAEKADQFRRAVAALFPGAFRASSVDVLSVSGGTAGTTVRFRITPLPASVSLNSVLDQLDAVMRNVSHPLRSSFPAFLAAVRGLRESDVVTQTKTPDPPADLIESWFCRGTRCFFATPAPDSDDGLGGFEIAGIILMCIVCVVIIFLCVVVALSHKKLSALARVESSLGAHDAQRKKIGEEVDKAKKRLEAHEQELEMHDKGLEQILGPAGSPARARAADPQKPQLPLRESVMEYGRRLDVVEDDVARQRRALRDQII